MKLRNLFGFGHKKVPVKTASEEMESLSVTSLKRDLRQLDQKLDQILKAQPRSSTASPLPVGACSALASIGHIKGLVESLANRQQQPPQFNQQNSSVEASIRALKNDLQGQLSMLQSSRSAGTDRQIPDMSEQVRKAVVTALLNAGPTDLLPDWKIAADERATQLQAALDAANRQTEEKAREHQRELELERDRAAKQRESDMAQWQKDRDEAQRAAEDVLQIEKADRARVEAMLKTEHDTEIATMKALHVQEQASLTSQIDEQKRKVWPELIREDELAEFRDAVMQSYYAGSAEGSRLYAELVKLAGLREDPQKFCEQVIPLGRALYDWTSSRYGRDNVAWDELIARWATSKVSEYGFEVVPVKVGERYNSLIHNCAVVNGDTISKVKSFLIRNQAGIAKSLAVVELK